MLATGSVATEQPAQINATLVGPGTICIIPKSLFVQLPHSVANAYSVHAIKPSTLYIGILIWVLVYFYKYIKPICLC